MSVDFRVFTLLARAMRYTSIDTAGMARILGVRRRTLERWIRLERAAPWETLESAYALGFVLEHIADVIGGENVEAWLFTCLPPIGNERPVDLVRSGRARELLDLVDALDRTYDPDPDAFEFDPTLEVDDDTGIVFAGPNPVRELDAEP